MCVKEEGTRKHNYESQKYRQTKCKKHTAEADKRGDETETTDTQWKITGRMTSCSQKRNMTRVKQQERNILNWMTEMGSWLYFLLWLLLLMLLRTLWYWVPPKDVHVCKCYVFSWAAGSCLQGVEFSRLSEFRLCFRLLRKTAKSDC